MPGLPVQSRQIPRFDLLGPESVDDYHHSNSVGTGSLTPDWTGSAGLGRGNRTSIPRGSDSRSGTHHIDERRWRCYRRRHTECPPGKRLLDWRWSGHPDHGSVLSFIWLLTLVERADWFDVNATHILAGVDALVVLGTVATVWLIRRLQKPEGHGAK